MENGRYIKSNHLLAQAKKVTPLGAQTFSKSYRYFSEGNAPAFLERGEGCHVWDVDGNRFIDFVCSLGAVTVGYNDPRVNAAVERQLHKGISFSMAAELEVELAQKLIEVIPCAEMIRFVKNGSDATASAVRLARAYTGRDMVAVCGYHGMQDWYIGSTENRAGVPEDVCKLSKSFEYNNIDSLEKLFELYPGQIAAVILEPIQGDGPAEGFLQGLKKTVNANGALLIFDEVVSGFRYALGGASELYNVTPDLAACGKGMGNGFAVSAVVGSKEILELISEKGVFVSTTFGGEALSLAGALETVRILEQPGTYENIWRLGELMLKGLHTLITEYGLHDVLSVSGLPPHGGVAFEGSGSLDYLDINTVFQQNLTERGILSVGINNFCLAHTEDEVNSYLEAAREGVREVREAVDRDSVDGLLRGAKLDPVFKRNIK